MFATTEHWTQQNGLRLHSVSSAIGITAQVPLVFVPGGLGAAEDYLPDMWELAPRPCLAVSLRGQGLSDAPASGYQLADYVADLAGILAESGWKRPCLMAYSLAVPIALAYAAQFPHALAGLILGDYPAETYRLPPEWVDSAMLYLGRLSQRHVMEAMQRESADESLWHLLPQIRCPVLLLRGGQADARLNSAQAARYLTGLPQVYEVVFPESGHALWEPDDGRFRQTIQEFLAHLDQQTSSRGGEV